MGTEELQVKLKFLKWQALYEVEKPFQIFVNLPENAEDQRTTNLIFEDVHVAVHDVREYGSKFDIDKCGFSYCYHETKFVNFNNREDVEKHYLPEVEDVLRKNLEDVDRVFFFDWRLRKNAPEVEGTIIDLNDYTTWLRPALHVHIDQSPAAVLNRILMQLSDEADYLLRGRIRVVNVWRPLVDVVQDWPLAICDGSTVRREDLVEADHVRRHYTGSTMYLQHNRGQKFYYMSNQTKSDVLVFKNFDSDSKITAQFAPHSSFLLPSVPDDALPRESIEVRALVFTYEKPSLDMPEGFAKESR